MHPDKGSIVEAKFQVSKDKWSEENFKNSLSSRTLIIERLEHQNKKSED
jgi:hypothetical protein